MLSVELGLALGKHAWNEQFIPNGRKDISGKRKTFLAVFVESSLPKSDPPQKVLRTVQSSSLLSFSSLAPSVALGTNPVDGRSGTACRVGPTWLLATGSARRDGRRSASGVILCIFSIILNSFLGELRTYGIVYN